jgi:hypothetical protein
MLARVPFAYQKAEEHFNKANEAAKEIGAKGILGQAYLDLGLLHNAKGKRRTKRRDASPRLLVYLRNVRLKFI